MKPETGIKWLFLDLNSYFASVEQQLDPALRGKPVAVVPMETDATCAIAASYEAKAYGIKTGTKIYEAKKLCPDLKCVLARHDHYVEYHHKILEEIIKHVPINKVWSIDELSSRLPERLRSIEAAKDIAHKIKAGLRDNVGEMIRCSIGLAPNSFLAKVATDMQKPDGLTILHPDILPGPLLDLKLRDLPGIGANMEVRLNRAGIYTMAQFWNTEPKQARKIWGSVGGEKFWYNLHGYDVPDTVTSKSTIGHSRMLDPDLRPPAAARIVARRLTVKAATRLRRHEFYATKFSLSIRTVDNKKWTQEKRLSPAQDNFTFLTLLDEMWGDIPHINHPALRLKKVAVTLYGLRKPEEITPDLFESVSTIHQKENAHNKAVSELIDTLNKKHGAETISLGISPKTAAGFVGTKIAFSRIPDREEFNE